MGNAKHYWQKVQQAIHQLALPRTRRLERELSDVVSENESLGVELARVRKEFENASDRERNKAAEFGQRITGLESERDTAHQQFNHLNTLLEESFASQKTSAEQVRGLEGKLDEERARHQSILETMQATIREGHREQQILKTLLEEASTSQEATAAHVMGLERKLDEDRVRHESLQETTQTALTQVRHEQQTLLQFQSALDDSIQKTKLQLLGAIQSESARPHYHVLGMAMFAALFLLSALAGTTSVWSIRQDLVEISAVSKDLKQFIEEHISQHELALLGLPAQTDTPVSVGPDDSTRGAVGGEVSDRGKPSLDFPDPRLGGEGQVVATHVFPVSTNKTGLNTAGQEASVPRQAKINGYAHQPGYGSGEWGPPLLLEEPAALGGAGPPVFDPLVKEMQADLLALGFDLGQEGADGFTGARTEQALREFQLLYVPVSGPQHKTDPDHLAPLVRRFSDLARKDQKQFKIDSGVLAAIRLSNLRTDVEFSFLMELAAAESTFDSDSRAVKSSAAGLYQFKQDTWLETVKRHGNKYGIGDYAAQVEYFVDSEGNRRPMISNPVVYQHVLDLRHNPRMAALMAAEYLKDNMRRLTLSLDRKLGRTEMYLTHFLGPSGAITFLRLLDKNPDKVAGDVFPGPAERNQHIFRPEPGKPRTVAEVYDVFDRKFNTSRYRDWRAN